MLGRVNPHGFGDNPAVTLTSERSDEHRTATQHEQADDAERQNHHPAKHLLGALAPDGIPGDLVHGHAGQHGHQQAGSDQAKQGHLGAYQAGASSAMPRGAFASSSNVTMSQASC